MVILIGIMVPCQIRDDVCTGTHDGHKDIGVVSHHKNLNMYLFEDVWCDTMEDSGTPTNSSQFSVLSILGDPENIGLNFGTTSHPKKGQARRGERRANTKTSSQPPPRLAS
jgi:hypothetical protein